MFFKIGTKGGEGCTLFPPRTGCQTHAPQISGKTFQIQKHLAENNQNDSTFYSNPFEIRIGVPPLLFLLFNFLLCSSAFRFSQKALITFDPISFLYIFEGLRSFLRQRWLSCWCFALHTVFWCAYGRLCSYFRFSMCGRHSRQTVMSFLYF